LISPRRILGIRQHGWDDNALDERVLRTHPAVQVDTIC
jgi:hypothetical protein